MHNNFAKTDASSETTTLYIRQTVSTIDYGFQFVLSARLLGVLDSSISRQMFSLYPNCDLICKNPKQSRIFENSDFCIMVFCITKAFFCSSIKSVIQIGLVLQG